MTFHSNTRGDTWDRILTLNIRSFGFAIIHTITCIILCNRFNLNVIIACLLRLKYKWSTCLIATNPSNAKACKTTFYSCIAAERKHFRLYLNDISLLVVIMSSVLLQEDNVDTKNTKGIWYIDRNIIWEVIRSLTICTN